MNILYPLCIILLGGVPAIYLLRYALKQRHKDKLLNEWFGAYTVYKSGPYNKEKAENVLRLSKALLSK